MIGIKPTITKIIWHVKWAFLFFFPIFASYYFTKLLIFWQEMIFSDKQQTIFFRPFSFTLNFFSIFIFLLFLSFFAVIIIKSQFRVFNTIIISSIFVAIFLFIIIFSVFQLDWVDVRKDIIRSGKTHYGFGDFRDYKWQDVLQIRIANDSQRSSSGLYVHNLFNPSFDLFFRDGSIISLWDSPTELPFGIPLTELPSPENLLTIIDFANSNNIPICVDETAYHKILEDIVFKEIPDSYIKKIEPVFTYGLRFQNCEFDEESVRRSLDKPYRLVDKIFLTLFVLTIVILIFSIIIDKYKFFPSYIYITDKICIGSAITLLILFGILLFFALSY